MTTKPTFEQAREDMADREMKACGGITDSMDIFYGATAGANWAKAWCDERTKVLLDALEYYGNRMGSGGKAREALAQHKELTGVRD